ncbi:MAG: DUF4340 domain-containing protein [Chitinivibrionales bacterium]|nr:DUF4340 domain-containing protein [Chitinivibrionales bacterium]
MKTKNLLTWVGIFAVVVIVVIVAGMLRNRRPSDEAQKFFPKLSESDIQKVMVATGGDTAVVHRKGDIWVVGEAEEEAAPTAAGGLAALSDSASQETAQTAEEEPVPAALREYPADSAAVASMLEKITTMNKDILASTKPEKQSMYQVDSAGGTYVQVWNDKGEKAGSFYIGKNSSAGWSSHYVRMDGSNKVYSVRGSIKYAFKANSKDWRDKTVTKFPKTSAARISLAKRSGQTIVVEKSTDSTGAPTWSMATPQQHKAEQSKIDDILNTLSNMKCTGWETDTELSEDSLGFNEPELVVSVTLEGGAERTVQIGNKKGTEDKFWVRTPAREGVTFLVSSYTINKLDVGVDELKAAEDTASDDASGGSDQGA